MARRDGGDDSFFFRDATIDSFSLPGALRERSISETTDLYPNATRASFSFRFAEATTASMLSMLFQQFPGFVEVRMVDAKPGIAFVEFDSETRSAVALSGLQGFKINPTHSMTLSYAKK
jgi:hypothetical protein